MKVNYNEIGSAAEMEVQLRCCSIYAVEEMRDLIQKRTRKQHAVHPDLDSSASFFDVYDGHEATVGVIVMTLPPEHASRHSSTKPGQKTAALTPPPQHASSQSSTKLCSQEATNKSARRALFSKDKTKGKKKSGKGKQKEMTWTLDAR
nr:queuosine salvage protein-like [Tanacetum cinerariifolium]